MSSLRPPTEKEIEKTLGEPVGFDISDAAAKIRRNLLLSSSVVLALIFGDIQTEPNFSTFGVSLTNVTPVKIMSGLGIVLVYNLLHYLWYCYELLGEWSVRVTGAKLTFLTGIEFSADGADYPSDPKQSTLYSWWRQESKSMESHAELLKKVEDKLAELDKRTDELQERDLTSAGTVGKAISELKYSVSQVGARLVEAEKIITSNRIPVSLARFDRRFRLLLTTRNLRVIIVEVYLPLVLALFALVFLIKYLIEG